MRKYIKTETLFILCLAAALTSLFSFWVNLFISAIIIFIFFRRNVAVVLVTLLLMITIFSGKFFIVTDVTAYQKSNLIKTPTARIYIDKDKFVQIGDLILGRFIIDNSRTRPFLKPVYQNEGDIKTIKIPIISGILKYRLAKSEEMFYATGGKVRTAQALIFADKRFLNEETKDEYVISGLAHLLAMSGMHVGIIIAIILSLFAPIPSKFRFFLAIWGVLMICAFGAFGITVVRASIFAVVYMMAYIFDIKIEPKKFLLFVVSLFILMSPSTIFDISFLLSFGACFGIIYMLDKGSSFLKAALMTGIAATLLTCPLSMFMFGATNHLSIISTIIMSPIIYLHILLSLLYLVVPDISIAPLVYIESFSNFLIHYITQYTYFAFILKTIPAWALITCALGTVIILFTRFRIFALLSLLIIFYPAAKAPDAIFPNLKGSDKGFVSFYDGRSEIFYQGSARTFKYEFMPIAAKYGVKTFDYGLIRIFGGNNKYISIKENGLDFKNICLNDKTSDCGIIYHTRSNSINKRNALDNITFIVYKNKFKSENIFEISSTGAIMIENGVIKSENDNKIK